LVFASELADERHGVIPAKAGIQIDFSYWIPAFAGMTIINKQFLNINRMNKQKSRLLALSIACLGPVLFACSELLSDLSGSDFQPDSTFSDTVPHDGVIYQNPVIQGFYPDPSVCRVGDDFYLVTSSFEYFPAIPVFHSRNLVDWRQIGHCLTTSRQFNATTTASSKGIAAPTIRYCQGVFYVITTDIGGRGNFYVTADNPAGPWSDPVFVGEAGFDPSLFFDNDGRCYYTSQEGSGLRSHIIQYEIDPVAGRLIGEKRFLWEGSGDGWTEGPHLYKINGCYYLMAAGGGTTTEHHEIIAASAFPNGPFTPCPHNPILSNRGTTLPVQCIGHADLVEDQNRRWWAVFLGMRYGTNGFSVLGRETFLAPVHWERGWPVIGDRGRIDLSMKGPLPQPPDPVTISIREEFDDNELPLCFCFIRNPQPGTGSLYDRPGWLRLNGNAVRLSDQAPPAFVGRRQQHFEMTARTRLSFTPQRSGEEAGLAVRMTDRAHYEIAVTRKDGSMLVFVRSCCNDTTIAVNSMNVRDSLHFLQIESSETGYTFSYSSDTLTFIPLATLSARDINPETNRAYTGAVIGMYATGNGALSSVPADFDWFEYIPR
jgi:xylan 1,4-beta-xylosidase